MSCITEILKLKGDKETLIPEGNWVAVEGGGTYKGYEYLVVLNTLGHRCGYVALPSDHKYSSVPEEKRKIRIDGPEYSHWDYDKVDVDCHGGLTFMSPKHGLKDLLPVKCSDMWVGFDCGHYGDGSDIEAFRKYYGEEEYEKRKDVLENFSYGEPVRDFKYVENECHSIIEQLQDKV